jgi:hypothetical protein
MQCSECQNDATHSYCLPGYERVYLCTAHVKTGAFIVLSDGSSTLHAAVLPLDAPAVPSAPQCTHKPHNASHVAPAVVAYSYPGEPLERGPGLEPGLACAACVIELVNTAQRVDWYVHLTELP